MTPVLPHAPQHAGPQTRDDNAATPPHGEKAGSAAARNAPAPTAVAGTLRKQPAQTAGEQRTAAAKAAREIPEPAILSTRPDTIYIMRRGECAASAGLSKFDVRKGYFNDKPYFHSEQRVTPTGVAAEPVAYRLSDDSCVTGIMLACFFLAALSVAGNMRVTGERVRSFFLAHDSGETTSHTGAEIRGRVFLMAQTCLTMAVLFFSHTQQRLAEVFNQIPPYILLGADTAVCAAYFALKIMAYGFVNWIFFDRRRNIQWMDSFVTCTTLEGAALFIVALLVVYMNMPFKAMAFAVVLLTATFKFTMAVKCVRVFFSYRLGIVHFITYFCILEITPALLLWKALVFFNETLIVNI